MTTIVLCGGAGTRLWPVSKSDLPKQFCDLLGGPSLFERTIARNAALGGRFVVVTNRAHREAARRGLPGVADLRQLANPGPHGHSPDPPRTLARWE